VDDAKDDLLRKYGTLVAFDLEAAVHLKKWDHLGQIIEVKRSRCPPFHHPLEID
jgi:hypothetical protein